MGRWAGAGRRRPAHLPELLINDSELEVIADDMLVEGDDEAGGLQGRVTNEHTAFVFLFFFTLLFIWAHSRLTML